MRFDTLTDRYVARLIATPLLATLVIAAMLLTLDKMLRLFDFVVSEGGPVSVVWRMLANLIPEYMSLGIPIGLMLGCLLAFRRLALSSELDVFRAVGMSYGRLLRVPYYYAVALALLNLAIVGFIQPYSRYAYEGLRFELRSGALGASIKVGEFTKLGKRMTIRVESSREGGRELSGIFVMTESKDGKSLAVTAEHGQFLATDDPDTIILRLQKGVLVHDAPQFKEPRVLQFVGHDLPIDLPKMEAFRQRGGRDLEMTMPELVVTAHRATTPAKQRAQFRSEFHFRLVEVATMFLLPMLALALAVPPKRSSSALGVFLSIVMIVTQHKINEYAASVAALGRIDPLIALWVPFLAFAALVWWMYRTIAHVPGGQPIGALERGADKAVKSVVRWIRFGRKEAA
ncbi:LPS export ABC transporter permease LptF [Rhizorhabdus histidinilytica]|uniref:Lipopolysaccharide export system permease protein n=1 Tax=Rhizorhabdus histidinilytica TaxID=439228 RepID=A0A1T5B047_9SPHN|nr:LPS export ABC transporter permease LptF [Rhizorhabdus histidinilytica]SKB40584.1 lipopolysaccharide export system permease protein [Rhizorhabdus histidinilytica]